MTGDAALLTLLQFADGLFPAGGFAHSFGLETYVQDERVRDRHDLELFLVAHLEGSAGPADAAAGAIAVGVARRADPEEWIALDARLDAMKTVPEFRTASRQMGRQTLRIAAGIGDDPFLAQLARAVDGGQAAGHHATVFGAAVGRGGADPERAAAAYLYATAALLVGAGLR
ncbi:MAG: urease accessory protein UreF, partial [Candidatus Rokuibacteriota bacterium]